MRSVGLRAHPCHLSRTSAEREMVQAVRRFAVVDAQLLGAVLLWALNITVTRYLLTHGFLPLAYGTTRYFVAALLALAFVYGLERSLRVQRRDLLIVIVAALMLYLNQISFVGSVHLTNASTVALILGAVPVFTGLFATLAGLGRQTRVFWAAAVVSLVGVGLIAGASGGVAASLLGDLLAVFCAAAWAGYSVLVTPLMRRYSPYRISALVLTIGWIPLSATGAVQVSHQHWSLPGAVWLLFGYAVVGPLFLTNILWYNAIGKVGPARASLFANLEPFVAVVLALVLLSEHLNRAEVAGAALILTAVIFERHTHAAANVSTIPGR
jgi:drug/metabolite transporter (DMT)-like permease